MLYKIKKITTKYKMKRVSGGKLYCAGCKFNHTYCEIDDDNTHKICSTNYSNWSNGKKKLKYQPT